MRFSKRADHNEILLKSSIISMAVYEKNPKLFLEDNEEMRSIDHKIEEICFSQSHNNQGVEYFNILSDICYLIVDDKKNNKLYICFRGTQNLKDLLLDAKLNSKTSDFNGRFHNGFYNRAQNVPKQYFIEKLQQGYELILTGHSLGAAVSANIVIHFLLYRFDISTEYAKKIIFVGFGCPSIADIYFKRNIEELFNENFIFIKNENDIVVEILEYISHFIYKRNQNNDSNLVKLIDFINDILSHTTDVARNQEKCNQMKAFVGTMANIITPKYTRFGTLYKLSKKDGLKEVLNFEFNEDSFSEMFNDPGLLICKIQDHLIKNYFHNLKNTSFSGRIDINQRNIIPSINLNAYLNFEIKEGDVKDMRIIKMRDNTDIILSIKKSVKNIEYLVAIKLIMRLGYKDTNAVTLYFKNDTYKVLDDESIYFKFNCLNEKLYDKINNLKYKVFVYEFYSHFNSKPIEIMINSESNKFRKNKKPGLYQKHKLIDNMRFDLMYLHAAFYLHSLERIEHLNQNFKDVKNELLEIFESLDTILRKIWEEKKENERVYTEKDLNEMRSLVENYFNLAGIGIELNTSNFLLNDIKFEEKLEGFKCQIQKTLTKNNGQEALLKSIIPYLYELNKRTCRIQSLSEKLKNNIFEASFYQTIGYAACKVLGLIVTLVGVGFAGAGSGGIAVVAAAGVAGGALREKEGAGIVVSATKEIFKVAFEGAAEIENKLVNKVDQTRFPSNLDYDKVYEIIIKQSKKIKNDDSDNESLYFYEKSYDEEFVNHWSESKDKFIFKLILLNKQLRDILKKNYIFGSIGTKNAGKSKFVELITTQDTNSDTMNTTTKSKAYSIINENNELIYEKAVIIDYPHSNSNSLGEKLEFYFTRLLVDHIYLIFEAEAKGTTDDQTRLINLVKTNNFSGFTIINNKADKLFTSKNRNKLTFTKFKSDLTDNLIEKCVDVNSNSILFTCMDIEDGRLRDDEIKAMVGEGVILSEGMKRIVFEKIDSIIN